MNHQHTPHGLAIVRGLQDKPVWPGTYDEKARRSRAINRRTS